MIPLIHRSAWPRFCLPYTVWLLLLPTIVWGQAGGYAVGSLRRPLFAEEIGLGGIYTPFFPTAAAVFSNGASLSAVDHPGVSASFSSATFGLEQSGLLAFAMPLGRYAGVGVGIISEGVPNQRGYDPEFHPTGSISSQELTVVAAGGLAIGPGSMGASVRYIRRDLTGSVSDLESGYAFDLSGTLAFENKLFFSLSLNEIAGAMSETNGSTFHEIIPWSTRASASYVYTLTSHIESHREDPTGTPTIHFLRPSSYILGAAGVQMDQHDSIPVFSIGAESVPLAAINLGLRAGYRSNGDVSGGFFFILPVQFANDLRLEYAVRFHPLPGDITHHVSLSASF